MDIPALISRCGELVDADGRLLAVGGEPMHIRLGGGGVLVWKADDGGTFECFVCEATACGPINHQQACELIHTRGIRSVSVCFNEILDAAALYRMLDAGLCEEVTYGAPGACISFYYWDNVSERGRKIA